MGGKIAFLLCTAALTALFFCAFFFPETYRNIVPYRFYYVLTDSMEPAVGTNSLVLVRTYDDSMHIEKGDIIAFRAERFGEKIIIMHRVSHTERNEEGEVVYRTHPERSSVPDQYETKREDLLGVYLWHIPHGGKLLLFLKSRFGFLWICEILVILLIRESVSAVWEKRRSG